MKICTQRTVDLLKRELEIKKKELLEKILFSSLEKIFIENRIYREIEECETWEAVLETIDSGLEPYKPDFYREITQEDIIRLTEIKIKRISKFDSFKADDLMRKLEEDLKEVEYNLEHIIDFSITYYKNLLEKFGEGRERKTEIKTFDTISATKVAVANEKLYVNRADGFIGYGLKKNEYVCDCSDIDDIIVFTSSGIMKVVKVSDKVFVGKDILYAGIFKKGDDRMVYHLVYRDGALGKTMAKRFQVTAITRDKEYNLTKGNKGSKVLYFSANSNGESEIITVNLSANSSARVKVFEFDFGNLAIKGRGAGGNILTKYPVRKVVLKEKGASTLGGIEIYYDDTVGRINKEGRGSLLGSFDGNDRIIEFTSKGEYRLTDFDLSNRFDTTKAEIVEKFDPQKTVSVIYMDGESKTVYVKRFLIETNTLNKLYSVISEHSSSKLLFVTTKKNPKVKYIFQEGRKNVEDEISLESFIDVKGWKAQGNKLTQNKVKSVELISFDKEEEPKEIEAGDSIELDVKPKGPKDQLGLF